VIQVRGERDMLLRKLWIAAGPWSRAWMHVSKQVVCSGRGFVYHVENGELQEITAE